MLLVKRDKAVDKDNRKQTQLRVRLAGNQMRLAQNSAAIAAATWKSPKSRASNAARNSAKAQNSARNAAQLRKKQNAQTAKPNSLRAQNFARNAEPRQKQANNYL